jgi:hypothetical protein
VREPRRRVEKRRQRVVALERTVARRRRTQRLPGRGRLRGEKNASVGAGGKRSEIVALKKGEKKIWRKSRKIWRKRKREREKIVFFSLSFSLSFSFPSLSHSE